VLDDLRHRIEGMARMVAVSRGPASTRERCIDEIAAGVGESAFRGALELPQREFLEICGGGRLLRCLGAKQLSEPTVLDIAVRLARGFPKAPDEIAPILLAVLLYFNPDDTFVASYLKAALGGIVGAAAVVDAPLGGDIELLTMVAQSFRVSSLD
jgi:hypothetical protein